MAPSRFASLPRYLMRDALTCHQGAINCNQLQSRYLMRDALRRIQRGTPRQRALKGPQRFVRGALRGSSGSSSCGSLLGMQRLELRSGGRARLDGPAFLCILEQGVLLVELLLVVHAQV